MNLNEQFFESEVDFVDVGDGTVESEHPSERARKWTLPLLTGLVAGAFFTIASPVHATEPRVVPLESAAVELRQAGDAARSAAQNLDALMKEGHAIAARLRSGASVTSEGLVSEARRLVAVADLSATDDEEASLSAVAFVTGVKR
jgi:hypothetical protein